MKHQKIRGEPSKEDNLIVRGQPRETGKTSEDKRKTFKGGQPRSERTTQRTWENLEECEENLQRRTTSE